MMDFLRNLLMIFSLSVVTAQAQHMGCVVIYDQTFCEEEETYSFASAEVNWKVSKEDFQQKIKNIVFEKLQLEDPVVYDVHFWVNDFNTLQAIKIQGWSQSYNFLVAVPVDFNSWSRENIILRRMNAIPYPLNYGFALEEVLIHCQTECQKSHFDFIEKIPKVTSELLTADLILLRVEAWKEIEIIDKIKSDPESQNLFSKVELSPVVEANGYSFLAFRFIL